MIEPNCILFIFTNLTAHRAMLMKITALEERLYIYTIPLADSLAIVYSMTEIY